MPQGFKLRVPGLRIKARAPNFFSQRQRQITSNRAPDRGVLLACLFQTPPHSRGAKFEPWDCKVTPASCACQDLNTIGCILNNDGLDAGFG